MNLTITPVSVNHTFSLQNQNQNTAQNQNFGQLNVKYKNMPQRGVRALDSTIDGFLHFLETNLKKLGVDTERLNKKGYKLEIDAKDYEKFDDFSTSLLDKNGKVVQNNCHTAPTQEQIKATEFAKNVVQRLRLSA